MAEFFRINSKQIKSPKEITLSFEVLDKAERTMDGTMVVDVIGKKRRVDVSWEYLPKADMTLLTTETTASPFCTVSFNDSSTGNLVTMTARVQDLTYKPYYDWAKGTIIWKSVSVCFIER